MGTSLAFVIVLCMVILSRCESISNLILRADDDNVCSTDSCKEAATWLGESTNTSVDPCENFFQYACGGWIAKHPIPPSEKSYTASEATKIQLLQRVKDVLLNSPAGKTNSKAVVISQNLFQSCIDIETRGKIGTQPIKDLLIEYGGWPLLDLSGWKGDNYNWLDTAARIIRNLGGDLMLLIDVWSDALDSENYIFLVSHPSFLPGIRQMIDMTSRDRTKEIIDAYKQYITKSAELLGASIGDKDVKQAIEDIVNFESELAKTAIPKDSSRDPTSIYNKITISEIQNLTKSSSVNWKKFFNIILEGLDPVEDTTQVALLATDYVERLVPLIEKTDAKTLANYISWKIVSKVASFSTAEFRDAEFQFRKVMDGIQEMEPLHKVCATDVLDTLGFAVSRLYVEEYLGREAKSDVENLVQNLRNAYRKTLLETDWMDGKTTSAAVKKLEAMGAMLAYPDWIMDDKKLDEYYANVGSADSTSYFAARLTAQRASMVKMLKKWNQKTSRTTEWVIHPVVADSFMNPTANSIIFPAGLLQLPYYKYNRMQSMNYGAIGYAIGHEISHAFDDVGSQFDEHGDLQNWWSEDTRKKFDEKVKCFQEQYSKIVDPTTGLNLNGVNALADNVADNGAIRNAYKAYKLFLEINRNEQGKKLPGLDFTSDQLFFLSYASIFCGSSRKEYLEQYIQSNRHAPPEYRVLVPLSNSYDFAAAFNCPVGSVMNPKEKCVLW